VPYLQPAFSALDAGDIEHALNLLIEAVALDRSNRDEIRRVVVGILDELGLDHPLANNSRTKLASAFY
jgi:putative thioredoxin